MNNHHSYTVISLSAQVEYCFTFPSHLLDKFAFTSVQLYNTFNYPLLANVMVFTQYTMTPYHYEYLLLYDVCVMCYVLVFKLVQETSWWTSVRFSHKWNYITNCEYKLCILAGLNKEIDRHSHKNTRCSTQPSHAITPWGHHKK
jgi:hypothetical protein